jgi:hypothetical protein
MSRSTTRSIINFRHAFIAASSAWLLVQILVNMSLHVSDVLSAFAAYLAMYYNTWSIEVTGWQSMFALDMESI